MTRAQDRAARVRHELGLHGQVDAETVANRPGLEVWAWPFRVLREMQAGDLVAGAQSLGLRWQRFDDRVHHRTQAPAPGELPLDAGAPPARGPRRTGGG